MDTHVPGPPRRIRIIRKRPAAPATLAAQASPAATSLTPNVDAPLRKRVRYPVDGSTVSSPSRSKSARELTGQASASEPPAKREYSIGYRKPPKHTQFPPGTSGNKKGRPKGAKGLKTIVRDVMTAKVGLRLSGKVQRVSKIEALIHKMSEQAFNGNLRAIALLMQKYADAVPDELVKAVAAVTETVEDFDKHDKAILKALQRRLRETDDGDEPTEQ